MINTNQTSTENDVNSNSFKKKSQLNVLTFITKQGTKGLTVSDPWKKENNKKNHL